MTNQSDEIKVPGFMREKRSNVNNQTFNQTQTEEVQVPKKNRKKLKKIGFVAAELVYGAVAIGGAFYAHEQYKNYKDRQKADNLVNSYVSESVCVLPQSLYTANNYAFKYCDGTNLEQALQESNIDALVIGDTVYTEKGSEIAKIDAIVEYKDYENYVITEYNKIDERLITGNVIANENYTIAMNQKGEGVSKYKDIYINRFKVTEDYSQGIFFVMKNIKTKQIWSSNYSFNDKKEENYQIKFMPDKIEQEITKGNIKSKIKTTIASNEPVELRRLILENQGNEEETIEITTYFEPVLSKKEQDYAHPVFNNLFLISKFDEETNSLVFKRKKREKNTQEMYLMANLSTNSETIGDLEYEISEEKFIGRGNLGIPNMIKNSIPLSKKIGLVTEPIVALKRIVKIKPNEKINIDFVISVGEKLEKVKQNLQKYKSEENVKLAFELSKAKVEAESRYLRIKGKDIALYQKILSYMIFDNSIKSQRLYSMQLV